jgi:hypothetical protein
VAVAVAVQVQAPVPELVQALEQASELESVPVPESVQLLVLVLERDR